MKSTTRRPLQDWGKVAIDPTVAAEDRRIIADLEIRKVVREHVPVYSGGEEPRTIGEVVDGFIADALKDRQEIQSLTIEVSESWWRELCKERPE